MTLVPVGMLVLKRKGEIFTFRLHYGPGQEEQFVASFHASMLADDQSMQAAIATVSKLVQDMIERVSGIVPVTTPGPPPGAPQH